MGMIKVETSGSFPQRSRTFTANLHGHAHAVAEAMRWLAEEVLPAAIEQDHRLHDDGAKPKNGFDRPQHGRLRH
jgi:hypothetical protein